MSSKNIALISFILLSLINSFPVLGQTNRSTQANCYWKGNDGETKDQKCQVYLKGTEKSYTGYSLIWEDGYKTELIKKEDSSLFTTPSGTIAQFEGIVDINGTKIPQKIHLIGLGSIVLGNSCNLSKAVYKDVAGKGYKIEFMPYRGSSAVQFASGQLSHKSQGIIFKFSVSQSQGYGTTWISPRSSSEQSHAVYFFDSDLRHSPQVGLRAPASTYIFVEGLGSSDYYGNPRGREILLGDNMWKLDYCK